MKQPARTTQFISGEQGIHWDLSVSAFHCAPFRKAGMASPRSRPPGLGPTLRIVQNGVLKRPQVGHFPRYRAISFTCEKRRASAVASILESS